MGPNDGISSLVRRDTDSGHEFEQTPGDSEEQESLACCRPAS